MIILKFINWFLNLFRRKKETTIKVEYIKYNQTPFDLQLFNAINKYRENKNLPLLKLAPDEINDIGGAHTVWLNDNIITKEDFKLRGHYYSQIRFDQIQLRFPNTIHISENIAFGYNTADSCVSAWDASLHHYETMNSIKYTHLSVTNANKLFVETIYLNL